MVSGGRASACRRVPSRAWLCLGLSLLACCQREAPIAIGSNPWISFEFLHIAQRQGFFADQGIQVRLVEFGSLNDVTRAFQSGQIDAFGASPVELVRTAAQGGRQPKVFQIMDFSDGADVVLARASIADAAGLRGARVAVEPGTVTMFLLFRALESAGMTLDDVTVVPTDQLQMYDAFVAGRVDAVVTYPPVSAMIVATGQANEIFNSKRVPGEIADILAMDASLLDRRPEVAAAILRAFDRAVEYVEGNPSEAYAYMAARLQMTPEQVAALIEKDIHITPLAEQAALFGPDGPLASSLRINAELLRRSGDLPRDIDVGALIEDEPLQRALGAGHATKRAPSPKQ
jgi:NitT/TauT family transport system substrate-binding protein